MQPINVALKVSTYTNISLFGQPARRRCPINSCLSVSQSVRASFSNLVATNVSCMEIYVILYYPAIPIYYSYSRATCAQSGVFQSPRGQ